MRSQFQMQLKKKEMEVWLNYFHGKSSVSFIFQVLLSNTLTFCFHKNSSFPVKDTDRKFPSKVDMSLSAC